MKLDKDIEDLCIKFAPVGSRITCDPAPTDTDQDWLLLINKDALHDLVGYVVDQGYAFDGSDPGDINNTPEDQCFQSFSCGDINLIVTTSELFYDRFMAASSVAKRLNLLKKDDRVALFQAVLYGNRCDLPDPFAEELVA